MLRVIANFGLSLLLTVTLIWGGCLSCSQYFMFPAAKSGCCHPSSHCGKVPTQKPERQDCTIQPIAVPSPAPDIADASLAVAGIAVALAIPQFEREGGIRPLALRESPPDLCLLHSVLRI